MGPLMAGNYTRYIFNAIPAIAGAEAVVDVLKPNRMKVLIEASQTFPNVTARHKKGSSGLLHFSGKIEITIQTAVAAIHGIRGP